jgi:hypothetical protein
MSFTPLPRSKSRVPLSGPQRKDRGLAAPESAATAAAAQKQRRRRRASAGRAVQSRFLQDAAEKGRKKKEQLEKGIRTHNTHNTHNNINNINKINKIQRNKDPRIAAAGGAARPSTTAARKRAAGTPAAAASSRSRVHAARKNNHPSSMHAAARGGDATARLTGPAKGRADLPPRTPGAAATTNTANAAPGATLATASNVVAGGPSDSVRDLHERLMMSQTTIMQWLYATARLDDTVKLQASTMQRQVYAVWRATQQALSTTSHLERVLSAAKIARERKNALVREHRALVMVGAIDNSNGSESSSDRNKKYGISTEHQQLMVKSRGEFKAFAKALSESMGYVPVTGMTATASSESPVLEDALRDLKNITGALERAVSGEAATVASLSEAWSKLAAAATDASKLLSGPCVEALEAIDRLSAKQGSLEADARAAEFPRGAIGLALGRADAAIAAISSAHSATTRSM